MPISWRRARFSSSRAARERKIEDRAAKSLARKSCIGRENYATTITLISSNTSTFSRSTIRLQNVDLMFLLSAYGSRRGDDPFAYHAVRRRCVHSIGRGSGRLSGLFDG